MNVTANDFVDEATSRPPRRGARSERWHQSCFGASRDVGFGWLVPCCAWPPANGQAATCRALAPAWHSSRRDRAVPRPGALLAPQVKTSLGALPGPVQVWQQAQDLWADHVAERDKERRSTHARTSAMPS